MKICGIEGFSGYCKHIKINKDSIYCKKFRKKLKIIKDILGIIHIIACKDCEKEYK